MKTRIAKLLFTTVLIVLYAGTVYMLLQLAGIGWGFELCSHIASRTLSDYTIEPIAQFAYWLLFLPFVVTIAVIVTAEQYPHTTTNLLRCFGIALIFGLFNALPFSLVTETTIYCLMLRPFSIVVTGILPVILLAYGIIQGITSVELYTIIKKYSRKKIQPFLYK